MNNFEFMQEFRRLYQFFHPGKEPDEVQTTGYFDRLKFIPLSQFERICIDLKDTKSPKEFDMTNLVKYCRDYRQDHPIQPDPNKKCSCYNGFVYVGKKTMAFCKCPIGRKYYNTQPGENGKGKIRIATHEECQQAASGVPF
jgi:hypothetical protein